MRRPHSPLGVLLLALVWVGPCTAAAGLPPRPSELVPEGMHFYAEIDVEKLRRSGPAEAVRSLLSALGQRMGEIGVSIERIRTIVVAGDPDAALPNEKRPSLLIVEQDGAPPDLARMERFFGKEAQAPFRDARRGGIACRCNQQLCVARLPSGPSVVAAPQMFPLVVDLFTRRPGARRSLIHGQAAPLLRRLTREDPPVLSLWLALSESMRKDVSIKSKTSPRHVAAVLGALSQNKGGRARALLSADDAEGARTLSEWVKTRIESLAQQLDMKLLGLASYLMDVRVHSEDDLVVITLPLTEAGYAGLLMRAAGVVTSLTPPAQGAPAGTEKMDPGQPAKGGGP